MANLNISIAVCGSASAQLPQTFETKAWSIGKAIAEQGATLFTGATAGFPLAAVRGCNSVGGRSVGIAPGESAEDQFNRFENIDLSLLSHVIFTGVGYKMRDIVMIRSVDAIIAIGGGVGTLVEISTAIDIRNQLVFCRDLAALLIYMSKLMKYLTGIKGFLLSIKIQKS